LFEGCNHSMPSHPKVEQIGYAEFEALLHWAADLKGVKFQDCVAKVVNQSRKTCDKSSSMKRRLEVVFEAFCKRIPGRMTSFEFACMCRRLDVYKDNKFTISDVYELFREFADHNSIDFAGFMNMIGEVGERLESGRQIFIKFAEAAEDLEADEDVLMKMRLRIKAAANNAATSAGDRDWTQLFRSQDADGSGQITWDEFYIMCRKSLQLKDQDVHLRAVFQKLDKDGSGEVAIDELVGFVGDSPELSVKRRSSTILSGAQELPRSLESPRVHSARFLVNLTNLTCADISDRPVSAN